MFFCAYLCMYVCVCDEGVLSGCISFTLNFGSQRVSTTFVQNSNIYNKDTSLHYFSTWSSLSLRHMKICFFYVEKMKVPYPGCTAGAEELPSPRVLKDSLSHQLYEVGYRHATIAPSCLIPEASCVQQFYFRFFFRLTT